MNLDPAAPPLADFLGDLPGDMPQHDHSGFRLAARKNWEVGCNWKVYVDNYLEGYHIPIVHPGLFRELDYPNYRTETKKNYSIQFAPTRRADRIRTTSQDDEVRYFWVYPNLMLNVYPDNFSTNLIVPLSHDRTLTIFEWYFRDPDDAKTKSDLAETIAFSDEIQLEDIDICEAVQRGLASSTYTTGRYSPQRENGVHHFHGLYARDMGMVVGSPVAEPRRLRADIPRGMPPRPAPAALRITEHPSTHTPPHSAPPASSAHHPLGHERQLLRQLLQLIGVADHLALQRMDNIVMQLLARNPHVHQRAPLLEDALGLGDRAPKLARKRRIDTAAMLEELFDHLAGVVE